MQKKTKHNKQQHREMIFTAKENMTEKTKHSFKRNQVSMYLIACKHIRISSSFTDIYENLRKNPKPKT